MAGLVAMLQSRIKNCNKEIEDVPEGMNLCMNDCLVGLQLLSGFDTIISFQKGKNIF
jgi:hypothetical protein